MVPMDPGPIQSLMDDVLAWGQTTLGVRGTPPGSCLHTISMFRIQNRHR